MMTDQELKEAAIQYVKKCYERNKKVPSLRKIFKHFKKEKLSFTRFYKIFPGGMSEACALAAVPVPMERIKRTEKATNASRRRRRQVEKDLSAVEDEVVREVLARALEWEKRRDKAKALLEAEKREKEAKLEALKTEAELDPEKIPAYLEEIESPLLRTLRHACAIEKISLEDGCVKAVEYWDPNARSETKTFEDYVDYCISNWTWLVRMNNATDKYSGMTYDCRCSECNAKYEYVTEYYTSLPSVFKCPNCGKTIHYPCPVCKEAWPSKEHLVYDPETNTLRCPLCGTRYNVTPPAMRPKGSAYKDALKKRPEIPRFSAKKIFETLTQK